MSKKSSRYAIHYMSVCRWKLGISKEGKQEKQGKMGEKWEKGRTLFASAFGPVHDRVHAGMI